MNIKELIKEAHSNAIERGFYDCFACQGKKTTGGCSEDGDCFSCSKHEDNCVLTICLNCNGSGIEPTIKKLVHDKLEEELLEFANSYPSETFDKDSEQSEISDIILVLLAYCGQMNYNIEQAIIDKMKYNRTRPHKHGKEY